MLSIIKEIKLTNIIQNKYNNPQYQTISQFVGQIELYDLTMSKVKCYLLQQYPLQDLVPMILKHCKILTYEMLYHTIAWNYSKRIIKNIPNVFKRMTRNEAFRKYYMSSEIKRYDDNFCYKNGYYEFEEWQA
jgi:hypothetical protein